MNQTVSLHEFSTVERACSPECQTNCFTGEASAIYDPCGNLISLVAQSTGAEVWARAVDKNSDATIGIYDPFNMEIPFSAQATINPSYDQPINGPIEFQINSDCKKCLLSSISSNGGCYENNTLCSFVPYFSSDIIVINTGIFSWSNDSD